MIGIDLGDAKEYEKITSSNDSKALTVSKMTNGGLPVRAAVITVETNDVRFTLDGTAASDTVHHLYDVSERTEPIVLIGAPNVRNFRVRSAVNGTHGNIYVTYFF